MTTSNKQKHGIGFIPFMEDYRVYLNMHFQARIKHMRTMAYIVSVLEDRLKIDTNNPSFKVVSVQQLHEVIKGITKTTVTNYIENVCIQSIGLNNTIPATIIAHDPATDRKKGSWLDLNRDK